MSLTWFVVLDPYQLGASQRKNKNKKKIKNTKEAEVKKCFLFLRKNKENKKPDGKRDKMNEQRMRKLKFVCFLLPDVIPTHVLPPFFFDSRPI